METLLIGVIGAFSGAVTGVAIGLKIRKVQNRDLRVQLRDAFQRIDAATTIRPEPKR